MKKKKIAMGPSLLDWQLKPQGKTVGGIVDDSILPRRLRSDGKEMPIVTRDDSLVSELFRYIYK